MRNRDDPDGENLAECRRKHSADRMTSLVPDIWTSHRLVSLLFRGKFYIGPSPTCLSNTVVGRINHAGHFLEALEILAKFRWTMSGKRRVLSIATNQQRELHICRAFTKDPSHSQSCQQVSTKNASNVPTSAGEVEGGARGDAWLSPPRPGLRKGRRGSQFVMQTYAGITRPAHGPDPLATW